MDPWGPRVSGAEQAQPLGMGAPNYRHLSSNSPVTPLPRLGGRTLQWGLWRERWICVAGAPPSRQALESTGPKPSTSQQAPPLMHTLHELKGWRNSGVTLGLHSHPGPRQPLRTHPACWHAPFLAPAGLSSHAPPIPLCPQLYSAVLALMDDGGPCLVCRRTAWSPCAWLPAGSFAYSSSSVCSLGAAR